MTNQEPNAQGAQNAQSPAEVQNTDQGHMIPKSRFDEVNNKYKDVQAELDRVNTERKEANEKRLKEQEKYKELYDQSNEDLLKYKAKAEQVDAYEETLNGVLEAQVADIPEELQSLIPDELTTQGKLNWIAKNKALLLKPIAPDIGAGVSGSTQAQTTQVELSPEEKAAAKRFGYTEEEYAKYK